MKTFVDHRKAVEARLKDLGQTRYWLGKELESRGVMKMTMLYQYLKGKATSSEKFESICEVLDMKIAYDESDGKRAGSK